MKHILLIVPIMATFVSGTSCKAEREFTCTGITASKTVNGYSYTVMGYDENGKGTIIGIVAASSQQDAEKKAEALLRNKSVTAKSRCVPDSQGVLHPIK